MTLVTIESHPFNAETPLIALDRPLTPTPLFYVRNHFEMPGVDPATWRLRVDGLVQRPLELSLAELRRLPERTLAVTLECAGNGRSGMTPVPPGTPWGYGAVATAHFTGTPLRPVLERAGLKAEALEVVFYGCDRGEVEPGRSEPFARSLSVEAARNPDILLAWGMNGEPLPAEHGHPLRLVVPDWYGVASVKWLATISAVSAPFQGYYQKERYVYVGEEGTADDTPVSAMRVRALVARPQDGAELREAPVDVAGTAWSGLGRVVRVEVSADGGSSWAEAELDPPASPYAAAAWRFTWMPARAGTYALCARASDAAGHTQPLQPRWNTHGYGNNAVQRIHVTVSR